MHESLAYVTQDETCCLLSANSKGLFSSGFSICYAVIVKRTTVPVDVALAHVSSLILDREKDIAFIQDMIDSVGSKEEVIIELANAPKAYEEQCKEDTKLYNQPPVSADEVEALFKQTNAAYLSFFDKHFKEYSINRTIYDMSKGYIVVDEKGELGFDGLSLEEIDGFDLASDESFYDTEPSDLEDTLFENEKPEPTRHDPRIFSRKRPLEPEAEVSLVKKVCY